MQVLKMSQMTFIPCRSDVKDIKLRGIYFCNSHCAAADPFINSEITVQLL